MTPEYLGWLAWLVVVACGFGVACYFAGLLIGKAMGR